MVWITDTKLIFIILKKNLWIKPTNPIFLSETSQTIHKRLYLESPLYFGNIEREGAAFRIRAGQSSPTLIRSQQL